MPIDKLPGMWYNNNRNGEGITPKNQKGITTMRKMTITIRPLDSDGLRPMTNYLTKDDTETPNDCVRALQNAIDSGSISAIENAARDLLNNQRRNDAIVRHEDIISDILNIMQNNLRSGDVFSVNSIAKAIRSDYSYLCKRTKYGTCAPVGAVTIAIQRLMDRGQVKAIVARTECCSLTRVFVMN